MNGVHLCPHGKSPGSFKRYIWFEGVAWVCRINNEKWGNAIGGKYYAKGGTEPLWDATVFEIKIIKRIQQPDHNSSKESASLYLDYCLIQVNKGRQNCFCVNYTLGLVYPPMVKSKWTRTRAVLLYFERREPVIWRIKTAWCSGNPRGSIHAMFKRYPAFQFLATLSKGKSYTNMPQRKSASILITSCYHIYNISSSHKRFIRATAVPLVEGRRRRLALGRRCGALFLMAAQGVSATHQKVARSFRTIILFTDIKKVQANAKLWCFFLLI